jgi:putative ABC transport system permease protein
MTTTTLPPATAPPPVAPRARTTGGWRIATRLARREVRRRWGRTLLVMVLVLVPVFGMTVITTLVRTAHDSPARVFANEFGSANLVAIGDAPPPTGGWPAGTQVVHGKQVSDIGLLAPDGVARLANVTDFDLNNPVTKGAVLLREGRFPTTAGEALVSPNIARAFGVGVGDTLHLSKPAWNERVVGIGELATNWNDGLLAVRGNELDSSQLSSLDQVQQITLVQIPGHPSQAALQQYGPTFFSAESTSNNITKTVNWTLVAGAIALAISGVVISGAFAVGARRQLVTLGQLSANGASEGLLKRMLSLQGAWCGVLGTGVGMAAGVVTLSLMHGQFNDWIHRDIGPYVWSARDLVAIAVIGVLAATLAAYFPARTAARVPVLSALSGRRPLGSLPRSIVPIGLAIFGGGVVVLGLVAAASRSGGGNSLAAAAVLGALLVLAGTCCVSPVAVASLAHVGRHLRGAGRVAVRSIVRSRARSAAVVMALAAINGGAIAMGTAFASRSKPIGVSAPFMPDNALVLVRHTTDFFGTDTTTTFLPLEASTQQTIKTILPNATWNERRAVVGTVGTTANARGGPIGGPVGPEGGPFAGTGKRVAIAGPGPDTIVVADPAVLSLMGLSADDVATLDRVGAMVFPQADSSTSGATTVTVGEGTTATTIPAARPAHRLRATAGVDALITPAKAQELHAPIVAAGEIVTNPTAFNETQRASLDALTPTIMFGSNAPATPPTDITELIWAGPQSTSISADTVEQIILGIVVAIALLILAMSLALSAAETRDERDVLVSLGAPPRTMRGVAAWKAATLSFTAAALAVPTGFIPVAVAFHASVHAGSTAQLVFPWKTVFELLLIAPLLAALVAYVGSAIAQRIRPTQMSTFATD